jgi:hypothetical protein
MHEIMDKKFYLGPKFGTLFNKKWITISELLHAPTATPPAAAQAVVGLVRRRCSPTRLRPSLLLPFLCTTILACTRTRNCANPSPHDLGSLVRFSASHSSGCFSAMSTAPSNAHVASPWWPCTCAPPLGPGVDFGPQPDLVMPGWWWCVVMMMMVVLLLLCRILRLWRWQDGVVDATLALPLLPPYSALWATPTLFPPISFTGLCQVNLLLVLVYLVKQWCQLMGCCYGY